MDTKLLQTIKHICTLIPNKERQAKLKVLIDYILSQKEINASLSLNFICTHNSRRSHLSQIWAQIAAAYYKLSKVYCYSGGMEATAMYPMIKNSLVEQGFNIHILSKDNSNPIYFIENVNDLPPIICFSKRYDHPFNPQQNFGAIMTCDNADQNCPLIPNSTRISLPFSDPKAFDQHPFQKDKYLEKSIEIGSEMFYVFAKVKSIIDTKV